jgi:hypothetical protein
MLVFPYEARFRDKRPLLSGGVHARLGLWLPLAPLHVIDNLRLGDWPGRDYCVHFGHQTDSFVQSHDHLLIMLDVVVR